MTGGRVKTIIGVALVLIIFSATGQRNKTQLQREKQKNLEKIKETERILGETSRKKNNTLGELSALNQRIKQQEELITSIKAEIEILDEDIAENTSILNTLESDLKKLKEEFASMLFEAQKANEGLTKLTFLFASESFDQMLMRLKYMEQYGQVRKEQALAIATVQSQLTDQVKEIEKKKEEKNSLLTDEIKENDQLVSLKKKQRTVVRSLEKEEKKLKTDLDDTRKAIAKLDKLISDIVREELERAAREAKANAEKGKGASTALSSNFEENKNKFAWPVSGFVSQKFGRQTHPVLKGIEIQNDGINIQTKEGEIVKSIFEGEVRRVAYINSLFGVSVIVNHGDYFSVYTGLKDVYVKMGQKIGAHQDLGVVQVNAEGISELRFQIRKNIVALNPEDWLAN